MLWWELLGLSSITSHALMSQPKTWLWVSEKGYKGEVEWDVLGSKGFAMLECE